MEETGSALGILELDDLTLEIMRDILEMTPEEREKLLELWKEYKRRK